MSKMHVKTGDTVILLTGKYEFKKNKNGEPITGKVLEVFDEWGISQSEVQLQFEHVDALNEYHDIEIACNAYL